MPSRSRVEWIAIALLLVEGLSGTSVGVTLLGAVAGAPGGDAAIEIPAVLVLYGIALVVAAAGILLGRGWGWWLAIGPIVGGLVLLVLLRLAAGDEDAILLGGIVVWAITLGALLVIRPRAAA